MSTSAAADAITAESGVPLSAATLTALRAGDKTDSTNAKLGAIAKFFGVPEDYLLTPGTNPDIDAQLNLLQAIRDAGIQNIHTCGGATPAGPEALNELATLINQQINHDSPKRK
ncbi:XRE family transcriptional regulator [Mycobacterium talmoniae]|uniref:XRE family transcriptional regulator n=1 Tax=Mycobacterium talmoniae TaxID=1858794 RepID=UPI001058A32A|nr:XRE family transcriptional regulator [Mycobacterium talmoniae]